MGRRKPRRRGKNRAQQPGNVYIHIQGGAAHGMRVALPGVTSTQWRRAQERAEAGDIHAPEIWHLVVALSALVGSALDPSIWGEEDLRGFTRWVGLVDENAWSGVDEQELVALLRGEGASGV